MLLVQTETRTRNKRRWWLFAGTLVLGVIAVAGILAANNWPFKRDAILRALEESSARQVTIGSFRTTYFPPGCVAENVNFLHRVRKDLPPLITVKRLAIRGSYRGFFTTPKRIEAVIVTDMHLTIPRRRTDGTQPDVIPLNTGKGGQSLMIAKIVADGAVLDIESQEEGKEPYRLAIRKLTLRNIGKGGPMAYHATLMNPEPPGAIDSEGSFGPWQPANPGATPVSGSFRYENADLGIFHGIAGRLNASGTFRGMLRQIGTTGHVDVAGFEISHSNHPTNLATEFRATVNGTNGDTYIDEASSRFDHTTVVARGQVAGKPGEKGKTATLNLAVENGRVEEILRLVSSAAPAMKGAATLRGDAVWPPGPLPFLEKLRFNGCFGVAGGSFASNSTQDSLNRLGESSVGENKKEMAADSQTVISALSGRFSVENGTAALTGVALRVEGSQAHMQGTYNLLNTMVNIHGVLDTTGDLADTTSGLKSLALKIMTPIFKRQHGERIVPFEIEGPSSHAAVTLDLKARLKER